MLISPLVVETLRIVSSLASYSSSKYSITSGPGVSLLTLIQPLNPIVIKIIKTTTTN